jgi:DNA polymerase sigma
MDIYVAEIRQHKRDKSGPPGIFSMHYLASLLRMYGMTNVKVIEALVPICTFTNPDTQLKWDLNLHNTLAIENSKLIKTYIDLDDRIRPFLYLVKYFTRRRQINSGKYTKKERYHLLAN